MNNLKISLPSIHCESCIKVIDMTLKDLSWIREKQFDLDKKEVYIKYDKHITKGQKIVSAIKDEAWYDAIVIVDEEEKDENSDDDEEDVSKIETISPKVIENTPLLSSLEKIESGNKIAILNIEWMHCTSCAWLIEKSLKKVVWVDDVHVNFASEKARIKFDINKVKIVELEKVVLDAWYKANIQTKDTNQWDKRKHEIQYWLNKIIWGVVLSLPMGIFMFYDFIPRLPFEKIIMPYMGFISLILTTPVLFIFWKDFFSWAWSALKMKTFNMYSLISIWTLTAYIYSLYSYWNYIHETGTMFGLNGMKIPNIYFEVAAFLVTFVSIWKYLEAKAKWKTSEAIEKLMWLAPKTARVKKWNNTLDIPIEEVMNWDIIIIRPWDKIPVDWEIISGYSSIDESMLTWESIPVEKKQGSKVFTWTINKLWSFEFKATKVWEETALSQIIKLIEEAQWSKAPIQWFADKISAVFVPTVIIIAIITFLSWYFLWEATFATSLLYFSAVIVIACPCALWLATPTAIMVWTWKWAQNWILIKWWEPLEIAGKVNAIIFDKTWTITEWKPKVTNIISLWNYSESEILALSTSLEKKSEHPLAEAIVNHGQDLWSINYNVENFTAVPGAWVTWSINWQKYLLWTRKLMKDNNIDMNINSYIENLECEWKTVMMLANTTMIIWLIAVADTVKQTSVEAIERLKKIWIKVFMITWDNKKTANAIADIVKIDNVLAEVLPENKASEVKKLQWEWYVVAMVGDGINDSPALAQADLWIAMWSWADVAMESGSMIIMKNDLNDVITAIKLSKETYGKIKENMFFALFYNILWIPVAAWVFASFWFILKPELAGLAMAMSSVSVVINSLLLKNFHPKKINILSKWAPIIMTILFLFVFWEFSQVPSWVSITQAYTSTNPWLLSDINDYIARSQVKIGFDQANFPKIMIDSQTLPKNIKIKIWKMDFENNGVVLGFNEASMMIKEWLIDWVWAELKNFFWAPHIRITWILAPTHTLLDDLHIMNTSTFLSIQLTNDLLILQSPLGSLDYYYLYNASNIPYQYASLINPKKTEFIIDNKSYLAAYVWYTDAVEMVEEKEFSKIHDTLENENGSNLIIMWLPKKTYTMLDMMHFVPQKFRDNYFNSLRK